MSDNPNILEIARDYWGVILGMGTLVVGFRVGAARRAWDIERLGEEVSEMKSRLSDIEVTDRREAIALAHIQEQLKALQRSFDDLREDIRAKE